MHRILNPKHEVTIGVVGKYIELQDAYKSVYESITHAGIANDCKVNIRPHRRRGSREEGRTRVAERARWNSRPGRIRRSRHRGKNRRGAVTRAKTRCPITGFASACRSR